MARTTFSGPVYSNAGFVGAVTGTVTGAVAGNVTGNVTGNLIGTAPKVSNPTITHTPVLVTATKTLTAAEVASGYIYCNSASAVGLTLPTGTDLGTALGAVAGTVFDLYIDNTLGTSTGIVTLIVAVNGILSALAAAVAASAGLLTVPVGVTGQACFRLMFSSATAYTFTRIA
jgi:hypothetical protein